MVAGGGEVACQLWNFRAIAILAWMTEESRPQRLGFLADGFFVPPSIAQPAATVAMGLVPQEMHVCRVFGSISVLQEQFSVLRASHPRLVVCAAIVTVMLAQCHLLYSNRKVE